MRKEVGREEKVEGAERQARGMFPANQIHSVIHCPQVALTMLQHSLPQLQALRSCQLLQPGWEAETSRPESTGHSLHSYASLTSALLKGRSSTMCAPGLVLCETHLAC